MSSQTIGNVPSVPNLPQSYDCTGVRFIVGPGGTDILQKYVLVGWGTVRVERQGESEPTIYGYWQTVDTNSNRNDLGAVGPYYNPEIPQSMLKGILYQLKYVVGTLVKKGACGNTPSDALLKSMRSGSVTGIRRGAIAGFAGGEFFGGLGGVPGAVVGGFAGGTVGAAGGVLWGAGRAAACDFAGAYGQ